MRNISSYQYIKEMITCLQKHGFKNFQTHVSYREPEAIEITYIDDDNEERSSLVRDRRPLWNREQTVKRLNKKFQPI